MILDFMHAFVEEVLKLANTTTEKSLELAKWVTEYSLKMTEGSLSLLSDGFYFIETWHTGLKEASKQVRFSARITRQALNESINKTNDFFSIAYDAVELARKVAFDFIYDNRSISSILGAAHDDKFGISSIQMSFRQDGKDISPEEAVEFFKNSKKDKAILYIAGLLCDETLWEDSLIETEEGQVKKLGLSSIYLKEGFHPIFVRYNMGLHVSHNGKKLMEIFDIFFEKFPLEKLDVIVYSLGGLVFRSALYYAIKSNKSWLNRFGKVIIVGSPDGGSYIEKIGFWLGLIFEQSPEPISKMLGIIGNLRSDGIKDLSHGVIREEDWVDSWQIERYSKEMYFGELDNIDAYQFYSLITEKEENPFQHWFGDGIVEKDSLKYLTDRVYLKKPGDIPRSYEIQKANHFLIFENEYFQKNLFKILTGKFPNPD